MRRHSGPLPYIPLRDIAGPGVSLTIYCANRACGNSKAFDPLQLALAWGVDRGVWDLPFRCTKCGNRKYHLINGHDGNSNHTGRYFKPSYR